MKSQYILIFAVLLIVLSACAPAQDAGQTSQPADIPPNNIFSNPLSMDSTSEQIQQTMLTSATKWQTLFLDGTVTGYDPNGSGAVVDSFHQQVWIDQMAFRFRYLSGPVDSEVNYFKASDGVTIYEMDLKTGQTQTYNMAPMPAQPQYVPTLEAGSASPNPLWGQMGAPLGQLAYPSDFAQNQGTFKPVGTETILDRPTLIVEWTYVDNALPSFRAWLDVQTGVMLKKQDFGKGGGETLESEMTLTKDVFDATFAPELFGAPTEIPRFADPNEMALNPLQMGAGTGSGSEALGTLYFFTLPHQAGQLVQLVHLPGSCVLGATACPQLESISAPFPFSFNLNPLAWSPDGKLAAFAYSDNANGTPTKLWVFDPSVNQWTPLAQFPFIDPPFWSPDGTWLAFRMQDGQGGEDVYVVHRDGTELKNLTASGNLPADARPYVMDGWLTENIVVRSALPGREDSVYLIRASDGAVRPLFETLLTKAAFFPSHDGSFLAFDNYDSESQKHAVQMTEADGAHPVDLATFSGGSLYPIVWSPDNNRIAFVYYASYANGNPTADVYIVGRDGRNLAQVYKGVTVGRIVFSPDGMFLLVEETTTPTGGHLFAVNLDTLESRIIAAPGLSLDTDWYAPSWRP